MICELCLSKAGIKNKTTTKKIVWVLQILEAKFKKGRIFSVCFKVHLLIYCFKWQVVLKK